MLGRYNSMGNWFSTLVGAAGTYYQGQMAVDQAAQNLAMQERLAEQALQEQQRMAELKAKQMEEIMDLTKVIVLAGGGLTALIFLMKAMKKRKKK